MHGHIVCDWKGKKFFSISVNCEIEIIRSNLSIFYAVVYNMPYTITVCRKVRLLVCVFGGEWGKKIRVKIFIRLFPKGVRKKKQRAE